MGGYVDRLLEQAENTYGPSETTVCASYYRCNGGAVLKDGAYPIRTPILGADGNSLPQEIPADYNEISFVCLKPDGCLETSSTLSIRLQDARKETGRARLLDKAAGND